MNPVTATSTELKSQTLPGIEVPVVSKDHDFNAPIHKEHADALKELQTYPQTAQTSTVVQETPVITSTAVIAPDMATKIAKENAEFLRQ